MKILAQISRAKPEDFTLNKRASKSTIFTPFYVILGSKLCPKKTVRPYV